MNQLSTKQPEVQYRIWCFERMMWWRPGENGYTRLLKEAGIYSAPDAHRIVLKANIMLTQTGKLQEALVPVEDGYF